MLRQQTYRSTDHQHQDQDQVVGRRLSDEVRNGYSTKDVTFTYDIMVISQDVFDVARV